MKKKILMALGLMSVALLSIGGTLAFDTDRDSSTGTFTVGNINVDLLTDASLAGEDGVVRLMPGKVNGVDPDAKIANVGTNDAYVWLTVKIPSSLDQATNAYDNVLHWNFSGKYLDTHYTDGVTYEETWRLPVVRDENKTEEKVDGTVVNMPAVSEETGQWMYEFETVVEDEVEYHVYTFLYNGVLSSGETTGRIISGAYLDQRIDYNDEVGKWAFVEKGVETFIDHDFTKAAAMVLEAYAIQADGFDSVDDAYVAYHNQWDK